MLEILKRAILVWFFASASCQVYIYVNLDNIVPQGRNKGLGKIIEIRDEHFIVSELHYWIYYISFYSIFASVVVSVVLTLYLNRFHGRR